MEPTYVLIYGDFADGFVHVGPFASRHDADVYANSEPCNRNTGAYPQCVMLQAPATEEN
jgi:hypothetical protein